MARYRNVRSDLTADERVSALATSEGGNLAWTAYICALLHADDWGRLHGDARTFRAVCLPHGVAPDLDVLNRTLNHIAAIGLWQRYEVADRWYIAFPFERWARHQNDIPRKRLQSDGGKIPAPPGWKPLPVTGGAVSTTKPKPAIGKSEREALRPYFDAFRRARYPKMADSDTIPEATFISAFSTLRKWHKDPTVTPAGVECMTAATIRKWGGVDYVGNVGVVARNWLDVSQWIADGEPGKKPHPSTREEPAQPVRRALREIQ